MVFLVQQPIRHESQIGIPNYQYRLEVTGEHGEIVVQEEQSQQLQLSYKGSVIFNLKCFYQCPGNGTYHCFRGFRFTL